jgi:hypothetical protein
VIATRKRSLAPADASPKARVNFGRRSEERHQARPRQDEKAEHQRLGSVDSHTFAHLACRTVSPNTGPL